MTGLACRLGAVIVVLALWAAGPVVAQENLDQGKTPAQLYASDCAICHKSPRGLSTAGGLFGLQNFLREHYTASIQSAVAIAAYLQAVDRKALPRARTRATRRPPRQPPAPKARPKPATQEKAGETKNSGQPVDVKEDAKPGSDKPAAEKPADFQPADSKPAETEPAVSVPSEATTPKREGPEATSKSESKAEINSEAGSEPKSGEAKAGAPKPGAGDSVPDIIKPEKSD